MNELLTQLYYKEKNFDGANILYRKAKAINKNITHKIVKDWLNAQSVVQQTKQTTNKKPVFLPIYSDLPHSFQIDLTFFPKYKKQNKGFYVLFTAININTRVAYAYYSKSKEAETIVAMLKKFHEDTLINSIACDLGTEFTNIHFKKYCEKHNIDLFYMKADSHKLGIINRFHRTLKNKMLKYFIVGNTVRWIDGLDDIIDNYNDTFHRGIRIEPNKADAFIEADIVAEAKMKTNKIKANEIAYNIGDKIRVLSTKDVFEKASTTYSPEVYTIEKVNKNSIRLSNGTTVKKTAAIITNEVQNETSNTKKVKAEKEHKVDLKMNKEGIKKSKTINVPRQLRSSKAQTRSMIKKK
jgi:hypothetical protein